jgi:esterase/lipase superfamily enzyme
MSKETTKWRSERLEREVTVVRWGTSGTPVLIFPTAAGDAEECERFLMIRELAPLLTEGKIKLYSVDSVGGQALLDDELNAVQAARVQNRFDSFVYHEVVPAIRKDCQSPDIEVVVTGASIGAFNALAAVCRHPDVFSKAICMSGTYDLRKFMEGDPGEDDYYNSPLRFVPKLDDRGEHLRRLRTRFVLLAHGRGKWEDPDQSWKTADVLGARGIPNRVDAWGAEWNHDWPTWRAMLPKYLGEFV